MSELTNKFREEFKDRETRRIYVDDFLNTQIATQIKVLREQRGLTQAALAESAEMRQERISVLEDVDYSSWTINVLRRLAEAFDLRLSVKFESFGSYLYEFENFSRESLERPSFEDDPVFQEQPAISSTWDWGSTEFKVTKFHTSKPIEYGVQPDSLFTKEETTGYMPSIFTRGESIELPM
jgi:transcriptional regulator with XRE-family HTH domain